MARYLLAAAGLASLPAAAHAQAISAREAAVAIDRVEVPSESFGLERIAAGLRRPWSFAFLPDGAILVSEKHHGLRLVRGGVPAPATMTGGPPDVYMQADSGVLDIVLDPDFATNRFVYLAYAQGDAKANRTAIWKARLEGDRLVGGKTIFRVSPAKATPNHPGGRLLFLPDKTLMLSVGDGFNYRDAAQDMGSHLGKILRLTREGTVPADNPFVGRAGTLPEIWSSGHRNIQGLTLDPATGTVWAHEHGPRGGDEINRIRAGANYGWPLLTHGVDYSGELLSERTAGEGFDRSSFYWAPSIAPSGFAIFHGARYPGWEGKFFVGGLAAHTVVRLSIGKDTGLFVEEERMFAGLRARIRDVRLGPDGYLYLLTDADPGELLRIVPAER